MAACCELQASQVASTRHVKHSTVASRNTSTPIQAHSLTSLPKLATHLSWILKARLHLKPHTRLRTPTQGRKEACNQTLGALVLLAGQT